MFKHTSSFLIASCLMGTVAFAQTDRSPQPTRQQQPTPQQQPMQQQQQPMQQQRMEQNETQRDAYRSTTRESETITGSMAEGETIVDKAAASPQYSMLVKAVKATDLTATLGGEGPYTVFAPSDDAFNQLPADKRDQLMQPSNREKLRNILLNHVVEGEMRASDLRDGMMLKTVGGEQLKVSMKGNDVMINGAKVKNADIEASNGIIHGIESVMMPGQDNMKGDMKKGDTKYNKKAGRK